MPHQLGSGAPDPNDTSYGGHAYAVSNPMQGSSSGPDLTGLFVTSQTKSDKERESETSLSHNGKSNGTNLPPEYNSVQILYFFNNASVLLYALQVYTLDGITKFF